MSQEMQRGTMDEAPGRVPPEDREWGLCRRITPELDRLLERKGLRYPGADHIVVLKVDQRNVILCYWRGARALGYRWAVASVGRDVVRLGAPESV
jgi:hypothetical protein